MTQEDKKLLLKDLCSRLPYGFLYQVIYDNRTPQTPNKVIIDDKFTLFDGWQVHEIKPYLRPMSSMTEEEKREVEKFGVCDDGAFHNDVYDVGICMEEAFTAISWFLERHFDINYLIQKGLALEAPEGMYKV